MHLDGGSSVLTDDPFRRRRASLERTAREDALVAVLRKAERRVTADASVGAGDEDCLASQLRGRDSCNRPTERPKLRASLRSHVNYVW